MNMKTNNESKFVMHRYRLNSKGFSLMQAMVSVGIGSLVTLGIAAAVANGMEGLSHSKNANIAEDLTVQISGMMGDPNYCSAHFGGIVISGGLPKKIADNVVLKNIEANGSLGSESIVQVGRAYQNSLTVESLSLNVSHMLGANRYLGYLALSAKSKSGTGIVFNRQVPIHISTDTAGRLVSCSRMSEPTQGTSQGVYSRTCLDFAAKGWPSKEACLQDGRWHLVYGNGAGGGTNFGRIKDLEDAIEEGAEIKALYNNKKNSEICQSVYRSDIGSRPIYCLGGVRFAGEAIPYLKSSAARVGTNGSIYCQPLDSPNVNECPGVTSAVDWLVKY